MTQKVLGPSGSKRRRRRMLMLTVLAASALAIFFVAGANAILPGSPSSFEANDGNMVAGTGNHDWNNVSFTNVPDTAAATSDNSFTPGQKQDTTCPTIEGHKNPPKDDFTDVASYSETASGGTYDGHVFLYGATIRYAANGNASENIELKQGTSGLCPGEPTGGLLARTPGDKLIAIDYLNGGTSVDFHVLTWVASGPCFVSNDTAPCWGATVLSLSTADAEGQASQAAITAANNPLTSQDLAAGQFAEFGIDLSGNSNIIPPGSCEAFPQTVWESRSSGSSFVSSTKDISIENKTISNCGQVIIRKHTDPRGNDQDFGFTSDLSGSELSCTQSTATSFTLNDSGNSSSDNAANTQDCTNVPAGSYTATESDPTADGYELESIDCSASSLTNGSTATPDEANLNVAIDLKAGDTIDCTFTNKPLQGALAIVKNSTKSGTAVLNDGAVFSYDSSSVTDNGTGDEDPAAGSVCVSGLALGDYTVNETSPPDGYGGAPASEADQTVTVVSGTNCSDNLPGAGATATFSNPPLSDIQVNFRDGGSGETSLAEDLSCDNTTGTSDTTAADGWDNSLTVTGVEAGSSTVTITCTIKIDP